MVLALFSLAWILGEYSTIHSQPTGLFVFFKWNIILVFLVWPSAGSSHTCETGADVLHFAYPPPTASTGRQTDTHTHIHTRIHTSTHTYSHILIHTHTHTHTYTQQTHTKTHRHTDTHTHTTYSHTRSLEFHGKVLSLNPICPKCFGKELKNLR